MKKLFTTILVYAVGVITSFAQVYSVNVTSNDVSMGTVSVVVVEGALPGVFSVSETKKVLFSSGNLQYQASTNTWRFAENQWDYIGNANENISSTYSGWIDLFGFGTSGCSTTLYYHGEGYNISIRVYAYPYSSIPTTECDLYTPLYYGPYSLDGSCFDWGVRNAISNGGGKAGLWRTLTDDEWSYLLSTRPTSLRSLATVNGKKGLIILPDNWRNPDGISYEATTGDCTTNTYTLAQWTIMEAAGAVFLPAAGYRSGTSMRNVGTRGYYWSSTEDDAGYAYYLYFLSNEARMDYDGRYYGRSVRLCTEL